ncbi:LacI family DNA-binding transcriptional regulator [Halalkalibacterium ligniniphilum]|uniref:LacI family DNA-binding transcriptional regulator n=1 Tax=Halalkalibacterium ligniniphilum TaxID=1134413 RepID=UPI00034CECE1|nr:LacI family DNA-binding transcriptional regulator [Halalkalibacterium ligniniphilum]
MSTIKDVAKRANVSVATVSRVLSKSSNVSKAKKEQVLKAIEELNYQPNALGRYLRTSQTMTILVVIPNITNPFFSNVLRGIQTYANQEGYRVLLMDVEHSGFQEQNYVDMLEQKQVDGLIMLTSRINPEVLHTISEKHPVVLACEYIEGSMIPTVSIDNISSARKMTEYLLGLGYKNIAHISGPMNTILSIDRLKGYKQALQARERPIKSSSIQEGDFTVESGYNVMTKLLAMESRPDAVFAANDEMAIGAIHAIKHRGLRVPEDIAVVGFDDIEIASYYDPPLTTIRQPTYKIGRKAMNLLIELLGKKTLSQQQFVLDDDLIIRKSCGHDVKTNFSWK